MTQQPARMSSLFKLEYPQSVGVYDTYDDAQRVVDFLADARFPVENLCIVGTELRSVERILGRRSWGNVIASGVQTGLSTGIMITLVMWVLQPSANFAVLMISALAVGILIGIAFAAVGYWMSRGKRDFRSASQIIATKYEVLAEHKVVGKARELVATMPGARAALFNPLPASPQPNVPPVQGGYPTPYPGYSQPYPAPPYPPPFSPQGYARPAQPPADLPNQDLAPNSPEPDAAASPSPEGTDPPGDGKRTDGAAS